MNPAPKWFEAGVCKFVMQAPYSSAVRASIDFLRALKRGLTLIRSKNITIKAQRTQKMTHKNRFLNLCELRALRGENKTHIKPQRHEEHKK
jgi:hypothetical protein